MADLSAVRREVAQALDSVPGLRAWAQVPDQIHPPVAIVEPDSVDFRTAFKRGHDQWTLNVFVLIGTSSSRAAQIRRDEFFNAGGARDVKDAIEAHDYGDAVQDLFVAEARGFNAYEFAGTTYLGVLFVLEVYA